MKALITLFFEWTNRIAEWVCYVLLATLVGIIVLQVFLRYVLKSPVSWSEEVALLLLVWFGMLAVAIAIYRHTHMAITVVWDRLSPPAQHVLNIFVEILVLLFALNIAINAGVLIEIVGDQALSASGFPKAWLYLPLQVGGVLMSMNSIGNLLLDHFPGKDASSTGIEI